MNIIQLSGISLLKYHAEFLLLKLFRLNITNNQLFTLFYIKNRYINIILVKELLKLYNAFIYMIICYCYHIFSYL